MHQPQATPFPTLGSPPAPPLSVDQREGIRNFLSNLIIRSTLDEAAFRKESTFVNKLNLILVQVRGREGGLMEGNGEVQRVISRGWREHRGINLILVQVRMWGGGARGVRGAEGEGQKAEQEGCSWVLRRGWARGERARDEPSFHLPSAWLCPSFFDPQSRDPMHFTHPHAPPCTPLLLRVQILKSDWPLKWASFIPDIVAASKTSETLCENTMRILRLLSEEVFDFARIDLTQAKTKVVWESVGLGGICVWGMCRARGWVVKDVSVQEFLFT